MKDCLDIDIQPELESVTKQRLYKAFVETFGHNGPNEWGEGFTHPPCNEDPNMPLVAIPLEHFQPPKGYDPHASLWELVGAGIVDLNGHIPCACPRCNQSITDGRMFHTVHDFDTMLRRAAYKPDSFFLFSTRNEKTIRKYGPDSIVPANDSVTGFACGEIVHDLRDLARILVTKHFGIDGNMADTEFRTLMYRIQPFLGNEDKPFYFGDIGIPPKERPLFGGPIATASLSQALLSQAYERYHQLGIEPDSQVVILYTKVGSTMFNILSKLMPLGVNIAYVNPRTFNTAPEDRHVVMVAPLRIIDAISTPSLTSIKDLYFDAREAQRSMGVKVKPQKVIDELVRARNII